MRISRTRRSAVSIENIYTNCSPSKRSLQVLLFVCPRLSSPFQCKFVELTNICEHIFRTALHCSELFHLRNPKLISTPPQSPLNLQFISVQLSSEFCSLQFGSCVRANNLLSKMFTFYYTNFIYANFAKFTHTCRQTALC